MLKASAFLLVEEGCVRVTGEVYRWNQENDCKGEVHLWIPVFEGGVTSEVSKNQRKCDGDVICIGGGTTELMEIL